MYETMYEADGGGLAAPQVGIGRRFFVYKTDDGPQVAINPEIVESSGEVEWTEGCLSIPASASRSSGPSSSRCGRWTSTATRSSSRPTTTSGRMFQHEIDHLDGILAIDRVDPDERKKALKAMRDRELDLAVDGAPARLFG